MKRILVVVPDFELGGVTISAINFCNELIKRGNEVCFLNMGRSMSSEMNRFNHQIRIISLDKFAKYWNLGIDDIQVARGRKKIKLLFWGIVKKITNRIGKWLDIVFSNYSVKQEYDVVVAYRQCAPCYYFALNCVKAKTKIAFIHGDINFMGDVSSWDIFFNEFDHIACVSHAVRDGFAACYNTISEKFKTVYNMLDIDDIRKKAKEKCPVDVDPKRVNLVTIARNENNHKQVDWVPRACSILKAQTNIPFHWYVIGAGPDLECNKKLAEDLQVVDEISFCGVLWNPYSILDACDLLVLPSKTESYGMVIAEAHVLHKPVVATYYPALVEVLEDGITGVIAEQNFEDLANKIKNLIENKNSTLECIRCRLQKLVMSNDLAYSQFIDML